MFKKNKLFIFLLTLSLIIISGFFLIIASESSDKRIILFSLWLFVLFGMAWWALDQKIIIHGRHGKQGRITYKGKDFTKLYNRFLFFGLFLCFILLMLSNFFSIQ